MKDRLQHAAVHRSQRVDMNLVTKQQWPVRKSLILISLIQRQNKKRTEQQEFEKAAGKQYFCGGPGFKTDLKQWIS